MKKSIINIASFLVAITCCLQAQIRFGGKDSSISIGKKGIFNVKSSHCEIKKGSLNVNTAQDNVGILAGNPISFKDATFIAGISESFLSGMFYPDTNGDVIIDDIQQFGSIHLAEHSSALEDVDSLITNPGGLLCKIKVGPGFSILRGQPLFFGHNDIELQDYTSILGLGIQNTLNSNIILNDGVIYLQNDLSLGDDATFVGNGQIVFNNRRISLGGTASRWTGNLFWNSALDLQMNSRIELEGAWAFFQDSQINGNSNVLDLANGGAIFVYPDSELRLSGVKIKGLGTGKIYLSPGSRLRLSDVEIEMNDHVDFYSGEIFIDGATSIITKDKLLTFRSTTPDDLVLVQDEYYNLVWAQGITTHGSLTIDRVALTYDPLEFIDQYNIRPLRINDPEHKYINIINGGSIRKFRMESISFLDYSSDTALQRYAVVFPVRPVKIFPEVIDGKLNYEVRVKGNSNYYRFTEAHQPLMFIADDVHAEYEDMLFSQFSAEYLELGHDASLIFSNNTTVELFRSEDLTYTWTFKGNTTIRGGGSILTLKDNGNIVVTDENSTLTIQDMTIKGLARDNIRCLQNSSHIILKDVTLVLDQDTSWDKGGFDIIGNVTIQGAHTFFYNSTQKSTITADSTLSLRRNLTFLYNPYLYSPATETEENLRKLLIMHDTSSTIYLEEATFSAPAPGIQFINGRFECNKYNTLLNDGGTDEKTGIVFGDGTEEHRVNMDIANPYALSVNSGIKIEL